MSEEESFIDSRFMRRDEELDQQLRPLSFADFPGQDAKKEQLQIYVQAAAERGDALGHLLLHGPPGLGKTTLAHIIANERGRKLKTSSGPVIERPADLAGLLNSLEEGDLLFIDEIHRLSTNVEEYLYSAMEDFFIDIILDQSSIRLDLARFTLIGATTRSGYISAPLLSRFQMQVRLELYPPEVLQQIVSRSAGILGVQIDSEGAYEIARRGRGTPRVANNLLNWVRDYAQVRADNDITKAVAEAALAMKGVDADGLDENDHRYLRVMVANFHGGPVGLKNIAVAMGEEERTVEDTIEPFLIREGYIVRTPQGRVVSPKTAQRFGREHAPRLGGDPQQPDLFGLDGNH